MTRFSACAVSVLIAAGYPAAASSQMGYPTTPYGHDSSWIDPAPHRSYFVNVRGVNLNCIDFRGSGPPILMIHGLGESPHIFDDLAMRLKDRYHIVAYARRGHGMSDSPIAPYDDQTLVQDVRELLSELRFPHAILIGWGMGGDEITSFAAKYPDKVDKLVYIDAGYDWSSPSFYKPFGKILAVNTPGPTYTSLDSLRAWYQRAWVGNAPWTSGLEAFLRDVMQLDRMGRPHPAPSGQAYGALTTTLSTWRREYKGVRAPALAIYASSYFPTDRTDPVLAAQLRDFEENTMVPFRRSSIERIQRELKNVKVVEIPDRTHISIGTQGVDSLAAIIDQFLSGSPP
ncbi:MAG TPA: alpha/beta hydrolase [Gemmatimonadales bacterium]|nr:alpha/beta hydrolase [Gemmatimonadales bacterium]